MSNALSNELLSPLSPRAAKGDVLTRLAQQPTAGVGVWPTRVDRLARQHGPDLLVKRDDLSAHGRGGAKARKIDLLVGHLLARGANQLITAAGNVTNLVFDLLPVLDRHGITPRLFILDDPPLPLEERRRIFAGVLDRVELVGPSRAHALARMGAAYVRARRAGRRPFVALPGMSHPAGVVGNARGFLEMVTGQLAAGGPVPGAVFVTAATGTTLAGFLLAEDALRRAGHPPIRVVGVQVYPGRAAWRTLAVLRWTERALGLASRVPASRIEIVASELGGGFARYDDRLATLCARVEAQTGIALDPIFGGKTWSAMETHLVSASDRRPTLYWHCGYTPEWRTLGDAVRGGRSGS
jgi:1-aminocyclopropane-1-carboxylate deaminase/D-cysteine desulfhydrase-like pyridoxal-dependent ACC family enzyme